MLLVTLTLQLSGLLVASQSIMVNITRVFMHYN